MMMSFTRSNAIFLIILVIFVTIIGQIHVQGARMLSEEFKNATDLTTSSYVYEKTKFTMAYRLERLASGPSPRGLGH